MIGISTVDFDASGAIYLFPESLDLAATNLFDSSRRSSRTATVDGGAVLFDAGYSAADRTITLKGNLSESQIEFCDRVVKGTSNVIVTTREGAYLAHPQSFSVNGRGSSLRLLVLSLAGE